MRPSNIAKQHQEGGRGRERVRWACDLSYNISGREEKKPTGNTVALRPSPNEIMAKRDMTHLALLDLHLLGPRGSL